jgi:uncharacterized protein YbbC (DUF1343 family)
MRTGLERLLAKPDAVKGRRVGLIANHTSVAGGCRYSWDLLREAGVDVRIIFSPEHGLFGTEQDQVRSAPSDGVPFPVASLYGESADSLAPLDEHLAEIDCVLFDIQDIGARYYTYLNTMVLFLRAVSGKGIEMIVLDRPNPLNGNTVEGPVLKKGYESFVGLLPVAVRHGLTAGEMARLAADYLSLDVSLTVIEMSGWTRDLYYDETGLAWVPPSPNMPTPATALVYPGACLFEGTSVSEGRGTTTPFELSGAPGVRPYGLAGRLNALDLPGVLFRPVYFRPTFNKHGGREIGGVFLHVTDRDMFRPFLTGVAMVVAYHELFEGFSFLTGAYEFNTTHPAFDLLAGSSAVREAIEAGKPLDRIVALWEKEEKVFSGIAGDYHRYGDRG